MSTFNIVLRFIGRHIFLIAVAATLVILGGLNNENIETFKNASIAECVAIVLSHLALFTFTSDNFKGSENRYAKTIIFLGVHMLVGFVYAGSYFVVFAPN